MQARQQAAARGEKFFFDGKTLALGGNQNETIHERVERLRLFLEKVTCVLPRLPYQGILACNRYGCSGTQKSEQRPHAGVLTGLRAWVL